MLMSDLIFNFNLLLLYIDLLFLNKSINLLVISNVWPTVDKWILNFISTVDKSLQVRREVGVVLLVGEGEEEGEWE